MGSVGTSEWKRRAYGRVYKAKFVESGTTIAAKKLEFPQSDEQRGSLSIFADLSANDLQKEVEILRKCGHANLITYLVGSSE